MSSLPLEATTDFARWSCRAEQSSRSILTFTEPMTP
jgi:hypothetical protein